AALGWRAHGLRVVGLRDSCRDRRARQVAAGKLARTGVRRLDRGRLIRPVPVLAARRALDGRLWLAGDAGDLLLHAAVCHPDGLDADATAAGGERAADRRLVTVAEAGI